MNHSSTVQSPTISLINKISPAINGKIIDSPISAFNNIISDISTTISLVVFEKSDYINPLRNNQVTQFKIGNKNVLDSLSIDSQIFFIDKSIHIMSFFKLFLHDNKMQVKVLKPGLSCNELGILANIHKHYDLVSQQFFRYIQMYNRITTNFDDVPTELVNQIINNIKSKRFNIKSAYLLPFKNKLSKIENTVDWSLYSKYEFLIKFRNNTYNKGFTYTIVKVLSEEVKNSCNLESIRYTDCDVIKTGTINYFHTEEFIKKLFYYGEIVQTATDKQTNK